MNSNGSRWLIAEPYVHGIVNRKDVLLYNTVSKVYLVYRENSRIAGIARQLLDPKNGYVISLSAAELKDPETGRFISDLRNKFMGDLHDPQWSPSKPFNIVPAPVIKQGRQLLESHLREITFHLDTSGHPETEPFQEACYQFPFPVYEAGPGTRLSPDIIRSVADQVSGLPFATMNFIGSGIFEEPLFSQLTGMFNDTPFKRKFHVPLSQLTLPASNRMGRNDYLCIYVTFPASPAHLDILLSAGLMYAKSPRVECNFVVRSDSDVEQASELIARLGFRQTFFKPYLDGNNMQFFREQVFISEDDIRASKPTQNQVFSRLSMNENDYGKLVILPDGSVFANMNDPLLGNIGQQSVADLVEKEIAVGRSWKRRRGITEPCSTCLYQFLCPPVSNYEILLHRFNFCHIIPE
jgi:pseudo-rSAM protein